MKSYQLLFIFLNIFATMTNCQVHSTKTMDIKYNEINTVTGLYVKSVLAQKSEIEEHFGHYKLIVNDSLEIILLPPYDPISIRPQEEVQRMEGKFVKVSGVIMDKTYMEKPTLDNDPQYMAKPCFITIDKIGLVNE